MPLNASKWFRRFLKIRSDNIYKVYITDAKVYLYIYANFSNIENTRKKEDLLSVQN